MKTKHAQEAWIKTSDRLPAEYEEVHAKHKDGSVRIARLSKAEGGCWQLATFLIDTKRPGYAWNPRDVVAWRSIQPASTISDAAPELLEALRELYESLDSCVDLTPERMWKARAAIAKATGEQP
ncbi:hypothetical protein [Bordetella avium]|uniref:hypothetical protein n=1 Tax=Bordetella avium TaxID=521 RepID=UPI00057B7984|nr:hypothetical protein [Bordetella avium]AZY49613.1 hypothetical protein C0J09_11045 [Bordetella avium]